MGAPGERAKRVARVRESQSSTIDWPARKKPGIVSNGSSQFPPEYTARSNAGEVHCRRIFVSSIEGAAARASASSEDAEDAYS
jgi:hypothetical protein